jgi:histidinol-phosphate aminotransferase
LRFLNTNIIMQHHIFSDILQKTESRIAGSKQTVKFRLDKNEQSADVDLAFKQRVIEQLLKSDWNRYPTIENSDIESKVAQYCGLSPENIVLSAGSASIITTLLDHFALQQKHIVITQPSYSLFDYHCKTNAITYEPWLLTAQLEYDDHSLPNLGANSVLIITSPNNPTGNVMPLDQMESLLSRYPDTCVIVDGVYTEFCDIDATPLVKKYPNLIVLRSFSKAFPVAGLRLGYLCAAPQTASIVKKLVLPFSINHFTLAFAREMFDDRTFMDKARKQVKDIIAERERMHRLISRRFESSLLQVFKSSGNFLLMRIHDDAAFNRLMEDLNFNGIKVLNTSNAPLLHNTFRVSIGTPYENETFFQHLKSSLNTNLSKAAIIPMKAFKAGKSVQLPLASQVALK